jgi:hypothetical protein
MKKNVMIIMPCWGRSEILSLVVDQYDLCFRVWECEMDMNVYMIFVVSPEDEEFEKIDTITGRFTGPSITVYCDNKSIGKKINTGINKALKFGCDYIMNTGSDNFIHPMIMNIYNQYMELNIDVFGMKNLCFYDAEKKKGIYFNNYNYPHVVGAGRMISQRAVNDVIRFYGSFYDEKITRGMDGHSASRLKALKYKETPIDMGPFPFIVDIKSKGNINSFDMVLRSRNKAGISPLDQSFLKHHFPNFNL